MNIAFIQKVRNFDRNLAGKRLLQPIESSEKVVFLFWHNLHAYRRLLLELL